MEALKRTHPPKTLLWRDVFFPFPGQAFMLPRGAVQAEGGDVLFIAVCKNPKGTVIHLPRGFKVTPRKEDMYTVTWATGNCIEVSDVSIPEDQPLEPDPTWIESATNRYRHALRVELTIDPRISSYMSALAANLMLVMQARKTLVEGEAIPRGKPAAILRSGIPSHPPSWLGRNYQILRAHTKHTPTGAHFTELDWRAGHYRVQHVGPKGEGQVKTILIDPYIAHSRGLVRPQL
jgi:hypothetical protein